MEYRSREIAEGIGRGLGHRASGDSEGTRGAELAIPSKNIREGSARIRDVVQAIHHSGAIDELVTAVHEAVIAARDTTKEINETAKELKERGVIKETATNVEETVVA